MKKKNLEGEKPQRVSTRKIAKIYNNSEKTAQAANLVYVHDTDRPCIRRKKHGKSFRYVIDGKPVKDKKTKERIKKLVIPPAWKDVWICIKENGHLQATGYDDKGRKQYLYHPHWIALRNRSKFYRMIQFAHALPQIRHQVEKDLAKRKLSRQKVLATVIALMERTNIRVGNNTYERLYGSYGLTTLKDKHIDIKGTTIRFAFKGKKGIYRDVSLRNRKLARIVQQCKEIPGKELFQYYDEEGTRHSIDSGMVNDYIQSITNEEFSAKDFRTWAGTVNAFIILQEMMKSDNDTNKKIINIVLDRVAASLGNTRAVCKKYYVHPLILEMHELGKLNEYYQHLDAIEEDENKYALSREERVILKLLEDNQN